MKHEIKPEFVGGPFGVRYDLSHVPPLLRAQYGTARICGAPRKSITLSGLVIRHHQERRIQSRKKLAYFTYALKNLFPSRSVPHPHWYE
jgi:hypothetical protein